MNIEIEIEHGADIASGVDIEGITQYVLEQEGCPATTEVSITLTTDEEVHRLNKEYRGIDRPTDVLSFECDGLDDDFDGGAAYDDAGVPDDEPFMLGDIIIASDYARAQTASSAPRRKRSSRCCSCMAFCTCADGIMCIPTKSRGHGGSRARDARRRGAAQHSLEAAAASRVRMVWRAVLLCAP